MNVLLLVSSIGMSLIQSQSLEEFYQIKKENTRNKYLTQLCKAQLKKEQIPSACYEISSVHKNQEFRSDLNQKCQNLKLSNIKLYQITKALKNQSIDTKCKKFLKEKEKILHYQEAGRSLNQKLDSYLKK